MYVNGNIRQRKNFDSVNGNENGNEKIMKNGNEMEKFETETDKFGYVFVSVVFPFHAITQVLCNVIR